MPEGDTIHRTAARLAKVLVGRRVVRVRSVLLALENAGIEGLSIERVQARGKHLMIGFSDGRVLHSHLGMNGVWRVLRPEQLASRTTQALRIALETDEWVAVCFNAPTVEIVRAKELERRGSVAGLGPDLLADEFDAVEARRRLRALGATSIAEALLDQRALAGIGNVFKSETLFVCETNPFARVDQLDDALLDRIVATARKQMRRNLAGTSRTTRRASDGPRLWVYRRSGELCLRCGVRVQMLRHGRTPRSTYWCPGCQRSPPEPGIE